MKPNARKPKHLVAVYGTLRKGYGNNRLIKDAEQILTMSIGGFEMKSLGAFPIAQVNKDKAIVVEIYHITDDELVACDRLEGHPNWYKRTQVGQLDIGDGEQPLWLYVMPSGEYPDAMPVESGDWNVHSKS